MFGGNIDTELYFIYGLIVLVILLIITVLIIDRKDNKKHRSRIKLTDTLNMKPLDEDNLRDKYDDYEVYDMLDGKIENPEFIDTMEIPELKIDIENIENVEDEEEVYHEEELEKTQAQIRVEEINKALKEANIEEKIEEEKDKYKDYEDEQEKNAFISYEDLKNSYDRLYAENEKNQYLEDNTIPINIKELYEANNREQDYIKEYEENKIEDIEILDDTPSHKFEEKKEINQTTEMGTDFLQALRELKNNL